MARFDVYRNPRRSAPQAPYLLDVQCDWVRTELRVVVPLVRADYHGPPMKRLNPMVEIDGQALVMSPTEIGSLPENQLGKPIASLAAQRDQVVAALDFLFQGY